MKFENYYDIDIKFLSQSLNLPAQAMNFSIHDSINSFFSNAEINLQDNTGLFRESLLNINGSSFELFFGDPNKTLKAKYVTRLSHSEEPKTFGTLNGDLNLFCEHEFFYQQKETNAAYKDKANKIVESTIKDYSFKKLNIKETDSTIVLYRISMNQKDFIEKNIIPNSFGSNCNDTPYYCFIDTENCFNFISWNEMYSTSPVAKLYYSSTKPADFDKNKIFSIKPFSKDFNDISKNISKTNFYRDYDSGDFFKVNSNISNFPKNEKEKFLPMLRSGVQSFETKSYFYKDYTRKELTKAQLIFDNKKTMNLEFFEIIVPFNSLIKSGKTIELEIKTQNEISKYNSGKFLVEDCIHTWDGKNKRGLTTLIVSRKQIFIPSNYRLKNLVMEG